MKIPKVKGFEKRPSFHNLALKRTIWQPCSASTNLERLEVWPSHTPLEQGLTHSIKYWPNSEFFKAKCERTNCKVSFPTILEHETEEYGS
ncbi:hypothetical protein AVEN_173507-1 [Araneus ventricosus]|uniref:Uncharacterized protein n=1 Tax=Araneus ventricosus TaxID=182803 RepID=A0A4Y2JNX3_ARAVE|nr:hypothetical protein AVEN_173507-1 [Araneus ventricosus]